MDAAHHKQLVRALFEATAAGDAQPFVSALADDVIWTITGSSAWSRTYRGKSAVLSGILAPLAAQLEGPIRIAAHRIIAEEDCVVVEGRGASRTRQGKAYGNTYCFVLRLQNDQIIEITEYGDTALIDDVLAAPDVQRTTSR